MIAVFFLLQIRSTNTRQWQYENFWSKLEMECDFLDENIMNSFLSLRYIKWFWKWWSQISKFRRWKCSIIIALLYRTIFFSCISLCLSTYCTPTSTAQLFCTGVIESSILFFLLQIKRTNTRQWQYENVWSKLEMECDILDKNIMNSFLP